MIMNMNSKQVHIEWGKENSNLIKAAYDLHISIDAGRAVLLSHTIMFLIYNTKFKLPFIN